MAQNKPGSNTKIELPENTGDLEEYCEILE